MYSIVRSKSRIASIETRCAPRAREYLRLFSGQPLFNALLYELAKTVGLLSQFDIERAMLKVRHNESGSRKRHRADW